MIKEIIKAIKRIIFVVILLCFATIYIDYLRISNGKSPLFSYKEYNARTKIETYRGFFYKATREINQDPKEPWESSNEITFKAFNKIIEIPEREKEKLDYTMLVSQQTECEEKSRLYFADKNVKVYTYCLENIKIREVGKTKSKELLSYLTKDYKMINNIKDKLKYTGIAEDKSTEVFKTLDDTLSNKKLIIYSCHKKNVNDVYIAPIDTPMQEEFCTYKDDDWDFLWEVVEEPYKGEKEFTPDLFYQTEKDLYELTATTKENVFLTTPEVRGKGTTKIPMMDAFKSGKVTLDELKKRGLHYQVVDKDQRAKEIKEKEEAERKKKEEEERKKKEEEERKKKEEEERIKKEAEEKAKLEAEQNNEG